MELRSPEVAFVVDIGAQASGKRTQRGCYMGEGRRYAFATLSVRRLRPRCSCSAPEGSYRGQCA